MRKEEARKIYKEKRKELTDAERAKADDLMLIQFQKIELPDIHHLLSYWPIEENQEPNTHLFNGYLEFKNPAIKFLYPKSEFEKHEMEAIEVDADTAFQKNAWNIHEPMDGTVTDAGAPTAPVNVRANADANHGTEITWEAEADIVGGLGGFIVLRDGRGIAKLPMQPPEAVYGRPLFQGLSYHDTPFAPLPQMRHVDMSAQPGAKHVYTVIALSSAGVPSMPSLPAAVE